MKSFTSHLNEKAGNGINIYKPNEQGGYTLKDHDCVKIHPGKSHKAWAKGEEIVDAGDNIDTLPKGAVGGVREAQLPAGLGKLTKVRADMLRDKSKKEIPGTQPLSGREVRRNRKIKKRAKELTRGPEGRKWGGTSPAKGKHGWGKSDGSGHLTRMGTGAPGAHEEVEEETSALTRSGVIPRSRKKREAEALRKQKWQEKVARIKKGKKKREKKWNRDVVLRGEEVEMNIDERVSVDGRTRDYRGTVKRLETSGRRNGEGIDGRMKGYRDALSRISARHQLDTPPEVEVEPEVSEPIDAVAPVEEGHGRGPHVSDYGPAAGTEKRKAAEKRGEKYVQKNPFHPDYKGKKHYIKRGKTKDTSGPIKDEIEEAKKQLYPDGATVKVVHPAKGKGVVKGKVVRHDKGYSGGSPFYVIYIPGVTQSVKVSDHNMIKEETPGYVKVRGPLTPAEKAKGARARAAGDRDLKKHREKKKNPIKVKLAKDKEIKHTMTDKTPKGYGPSEEVEMFDEARMGEILKNVKKGSSPYTIVAIKSGRVVGQEHAKIAQAVPAFVREMQKKYPNSKISVESRTGRVVHSEEVEQKSREEMIREFVMAEIWRTPREKYAKGAGGRGLVDKEAKQKQTGAEKVIAKLKAKHAAAAEFNKQQQSQTEATTGKKYRMDPRTTDKWKALFPQHGPQKRLTPAEEKKRRARELSREREHGGKTAMATKGPIPSKERAKHRAKRGKKVEEAKKQSFRPYDNAPVEPEDMQYLSDFYKEVHGSRPRGNTYKFIKTVGDYRKEIELLSSMAAEDRKRVKQARIVRKAGAAKEKRRSFGPKKSSGKSAMKLAFAKAKKKIK